MVLLGVDPHKDTHTVVAVDQTRRQLDQTVAARTLGHGELVGWARTRWPEPAQRIWALEDCRHVSSRLERDLLAAGERVVRVPPRLMAGARQAVRARGKSDPIDALAVARAALREPNLPVAQQDQASWEVKLLVDHREHLVAERTRQINRLRWHLHQLDPDLEHATRRLPGPGLRGITTWLAQTTARAGSPVQLGICRDQATAIGALTNQITELDRQLRTRVARLAPSLLGLPGCGTLTAAKLIAETAGVARFRSEACVAMHASVARSRSAPAVPTAIGCRGVVTGSSMPPCTASLSPSYACPAPARPTTSDAAPKAMGPARPSAPSSAASAAPSTSTSSSHNHRPPQPQPPLDRGAT
jgi:transposase